MTFEQYLNNNLKIGVIDHAIRVDSQVRGHPKFYIHPAYTGGLTVDFLVEGNDLHTVKLPIEGEVIE